MINLFMTTFNILIIIITKSIKKENYYKEGVIEILKNIISFFCSKFLLKKFIFKRFMFSSFTFAFQSTLSHIKNCFSNLLDSRTN